MAKYKKLGEKDVLTILDANIKQAVGYFDSKLSTERQRVMEYYTAKLPFPHHDGNSKFVSQDVYNAIESMKAALLEVFKYLAPFEIKGEYSCFKILFAFFSDVPITTLSG